MKKIEMGYYTDITKLDHTINYLTKAILRCIIFGMPEAMEKELVNRRECLMEYRDSLAQN